MISAANCHALVPRLFHRDAVLIGVTCKLYSTHRFTPFGFQFCVSCRHTLTRLHHEFSIRVNSFSRFTKFMPAVSISRGTARALDIESYKLHGAMHFRIRESRVMSAFEFFSIKALFIDAYAAVVVGLSRRSTPADKIA